MTILFADDNEMHRNFFTSTLEELGESYDFDLIKICQDGQELFETFKERSGQGVDCVFLDIRMPNLDGLSTLVKVRHVNPNQKVVMVSSEDMQKMKMAAHQHDTAKNIDLETQKKFDLLDKIARRLEAGEIEEGKINSILEGCEKLALDPVAAAEKYGASGYVRKPYKSERFKELIDKLSSASEFIVAN